MLRFPGYFEGGGILHWKMEWQTYNNMHINIYCYLLKQTAVYLNNQETPWLQFSGKIFWVHLVYNRIIQPTHFLPDCTDIWNQRVTYESECGWACSGAGRRSLQATHPSFPRNSAAALHVCCTISGKEMSDLRCSSEVLYTWPPTLWITFYAISGTLPNSNTVIQVSFINIWLLNPFIGLFSG